MASISQAASEDADYARTLFVVETLQGAREVVPIRFTTSGRPDDIADWHFAVSAEFGYAFVDTDAAGKTVLSGSAIASRQPAIAVPTIERDALRSNAVDLVIPPNLLVGDIPLDASPSHVVFLWLTVRKGSEVDAPETSVWRIPVVVRRGETGVVATAPTSPASPTEPVTLDAEDIRDELMSLQGGDRLDASAVKNLPTGGAGLDQSAVDARIMALRPNIFTASDETKLDGIEENATADQTPTEIRDALQGLSGNARLSASAVRDIPTGGGGLNQAGVDARIQALRPNAFTNADESKLDGIAAGAEVNVQSDWNASSGDAQILNKPTIPTPRTNAEIDGRILAPARTGNTSRWAKLKLPADTIYTATQRFTTALLAKLNGIENNAKDDQSPTEIRDALAGLTGNARLAATAIRDLPTGGGSTVRSFIVNVRPSATVSQTTTAINTYVAYEMLMTAPAITAAQAGNVEIKVHVHADVTTSTSGGGERVVTKARLRRRRGSTTTTTQDEFHFYGPRNVSQLDSDDADFYFAYAVDAQEGDVFFVEVQTASQVGSRTTEFNTTQNLMQITPIG